MPELLSCHIQQYADDAKLYSVIKNSSDISEFQKDLDSTVNWSNKWLLNFNFNKCKCMQLGNSTPTTYTLFDHDNGIRTNLNTVSEEKDLGVWYSSDLKPSLQCNKATAKAMKSLGLLRRTFSNINKKNFPFLYKTYIRPHLEYCIQIWAPYLVQDVNSLERVQRRATKLVKDISHLSYEERLRVLNLPSLRI